MSVRKAKQFYQELTPQQKHFVDNKTINTTLSVKHWIAFLKKASDFDEFAEKAKKKLIVRIVICVVVLIIMTFVVAASGIVYLLGVHAVAILLIIDAARALSYFNKNDINDYLRLFFMPFLEAMRVKAGEDAKLSASLDFRDPFKSIKPVESTDSFGRKVSLYEHKAIIAGVMLSDKTYFETVLLDEIKRIKYRNARGKSKSKDKTLHRIFIRLSASKQVYQLKTGIPVPPQVELSEDNDHIIFKLKDKSKDMSHHILGPDKYFLSLGILYGLLESAGGVKAGPTNAAMGTAGVAQTQPLIWNDMIFDRYDYSGFSSSRHHSHSHLHHDHGHGSHNVFES